MNNQTDKLTLVHQQQSQSSKPNLLIGVTGSVASIKLCTLIINLQSHFNIRVIATEHARKFIFNQHQCNEEQIQKSKQYQDRIYYDQMEWHMWKKRGDPVLHIQLRKWANIMIIAPLSANTLAKISNGICDNLLTLVCRAWPMHKQQQNNNNENNKIVLKQPIIVCPSMNTLMWQHPITQTQLNILTNWGYQVLGPVSKKMMCGDIGKGAMVQVQDICQCLLNKIGVNKKQIQKQK